MNLRRVANYTVGQCGVLVQPYGNAAPDLWIICRQGRLGGSPRCWLHERQLIRIESIPPEQRNDYEKQVLWRLYNPAMDERVSVGGGSSTASASLPQTSNESNA